MAVPKHRRSKSRKRMCRSINMKLTLPGMTKCPQCEGLTPSHRVCIHCGYYKKVPVIQVEKA